MDSRRSSAALCSTTRHQTDDRFRPPRGNESDPKIDVALDTADQSVSALFIEDGEWEPQVVHVLRQYLKAGSVFVDIGANVGWHTAVGSSIVGPTGRVYAIEPNPSRGNTNSADQLTIM